MEQAWRTPTRGAFLRARVYPPATAPYFPDVPLLGFASHSKTGAGNSPTACLCTSLFVALGFVLCFLRLG